MWDGELKVLALIRAKFSQSSRFSYVNCSHRVRDKYLHFPCLQKAKHIDISPISDSKIMFVSSPK